MYDFGWGRRSGLHRKSKLAATHPAHCVAGPTNLRKGTRMRRLARISLLVAVAAALGGIGALPALAATPRVEQGSFSFAVDEFDSGLCGFPIHIQAQASGSTTFLFDTAGNPVRLLVQFSIADGTFSANGVTLRQGSNHNATMYVFDSSGDVTTVTTVGVTTLVFLPRGVVIEAGRMVEDVAAGTVAFEGKSLTPGDGRALCGALGG